MYILMLSVIFVILVIISIMISMETNNNYDVKTLKGDNILEVDISRNSCFLEDISESMGLYNLSVYKVLNGYRGIVRGSTWNGCCTYNTTPAFSYPYEIELDEMGNMTHLKLVPINYSKVSNCVSNFRGIYANGIEDPRIFMFNNEEWIIGNCLGSHEQPHPCINAMCIFKLSDPDNTFKILSPPLDVDNLQRQKNWSPIEYNGKLLCEYSIEPHIILEIDINTGMTTKIYDSGPFTNNESFTKDITNEKSLRGGASPILIDNYYLSIGHIRVNDSPNYYHFFYTFEAKPPFKMIKISKFFKLYNNEKIQFVSGLSYMNDNLYISYGVDDCYNRISIHNINDIHKKYLSDV